MGNKGSKNTKSKRKKPKIHLDVLLPQSHQQESVTLFMNSLKKMAKSNPMLPPGFMFEMFDVNKSVWTSMIESNYGKKIPVDVMNLIHRLVFGRIYNEMCQIISKSHFKKVIFKF